MLLDEKIFANEELSKKVEFVTLQSSERRDEEIRYNNINRKLIIFDLSDHQMMLSLGKVLTPYGLQENFESKMVNSKIHVFRIWAEKKLVKRAETFLRVLYLKHPEKFAKVEYEHSKKKKMKLAKANYILSELVSQKSISLKDENEEYIDKLKDFKDRFTGEHQRLVLQESLMKDLTQDEQKEKHTLLEMQSDEA